MQQYQTSRTPPDGHPSKNKWGTGVSIGVLSLKQTRTTPQTMPAEHLWRLAPPNHTLPHYRRTAN